MKYEDLEKQMRFITTRTVAKGIPVIRMYYHFGAYESRGTRTNHFQISFNTKFTEKYFEGRNIKLIPMAVSTHEKGAVHLIFDPPKKEHAFYVHGIRPTKNKDYRSLAISSAKIVQTICDHLEINMSDYTRCRTDFEFERVLEENGTQVFRLTKGEVEYDYKKIVSNRHKNYAKVV